MNLLQSDKKELSEATHPFSSCLRVLSRHPRFDVIEDNLLLTHEQSSTAILRGYPKELTCSYTAAEMSVAIYVAVAVAGREAQLPQ